MLGAGGKLAVEEDGNAEAADLPGHLDRLGVGGAAIGWVEPDQRADVERPDRRVKPVVGAHLDRLDRLLGAGEERLAQRRRACRPG